MNTSSLLARYRSILLAAAAALAFGAVQAQTSAPVQATTSSVASPQLTIRDIYDRVDAAGYRDIREIKISKGRYKVKATDTDGKRVKLYVNGSTGTVEHVSKNH